MRRLVVLLISLAVLASGCSFLTRSKGPTVVNLHGLTAVSTEDADPIPWSPYNPPILSAVVYPAPLLGGHYEDCQAIIDDPFERICAADWSRTVITPGELESVSVVLMTGPQVTRFRVIFAGHRPGEVAEGVAISQEYVAPPYWSGEVEFEVPIYLPFTRVFFLQIQWRAEEGFWSGSSQDIFFAPCPPDYPWLEEEEGFCESVVR